MSGFAKVKKEVMRTSVLPLIFFYTFWGEQVHY